MEDKTLILEPLYEKVEAYTKTTLELMKLKTIDKTAQVTSTFVSRVIAILLFSLSIIILSIGVSFWLGDLLGKNYYGFICVALFYTLIGTILYFFMHESLKKSISNSIITQMLN